MAIKHNQQIPHNHFRKDWQRRVRVHFDQPGRKLRRRNARQAKAAVVAPRPIDKLRPIVRCPTIKYNRRVRAGRGFSIAELKEAGIPRKLAPTIGISVDPRRQNLSQESLAINVERLKTYQSRMILFPRKTSKPKKGDASQEEINSAKNTVSNLRTSIPITTVSGGVSEIKKSEMPEPVEGGAYRKLRDARSEARYSGKREKRAKDKADEAAAAKK
ncbi:BgTH12-07296 [Blumeria graminis f. sp. triticale]|uniref:Bgt-3864 n=3 Tax=Blumeria graminis TaxID=34373 RepID=A0A381L7N1_BLUGR|nr:Protein component of the large (60S) ribosomal subunit [Blumeria graminis f. sp. tritici 96224]CAD6506370.1 BgTH12-07296 [Blumeria graminis f. sp. triticale]VDB95152.1 Bgt-3864 [Blumeria graminis f. sp. tritici]